jgi:MFS family permease
MGQKIFYGWWIVLACFLINLYVGSVVFFGFTALFEPLIREFDWSHAQVSLAASIRGLEMGIMAPLIGFLVDRFGSRKLLVTGVVSVGLGLIVLGRTQSLVMFYGAFIIISFGAGGCASVVTMTVIANWFQRNVGKAIGIMASGFGFSGLFVPAIVWLVDIYYWRNAVFILGCGMWILGIPLSFIVRHSPERYGYLPDGDPAEPSLSRAEAYVSEKNIGLRETIKDRTFIIINCIEAVRMIAGQSVITHVMPYLASIGFSRRSAGIIASGIPLASIAGRLSFGWLGDKYQKKYLMVMVFCLMAIGILGFCYIQTLWGVALFLMLFPPGLGGSMVLRGAVLREYFGRYALGKIIGIVMGSASIGGVIGPTLTGWVFDTTGDYRDVWFLFCALMVIAVLMGLRIRPPARK